MRTIEHIASSEDLDRALARLDELWSARPGDADFEERTKLVDLIAAYEDEHVCVPLPDPVDAIAFRMEQAGLQQKDLVPYLGSPSKVSEVLARKRGLSKEMIRQLHKGLGIPLPALLGVEDTTPEGFVQVELCLPTATVEGLAEIAGIRGVAIDDLAASILASAATAVVRSNFPTETRGRVQATPTTLTARPKIELVA